MIKGVILAGGQGTRLRPFTHIINKHLLPVYDKPLIYYPLLAMKAAGVTEVLITSNEQDLPSFRKLLGDGAEFNMRIEYAAQDGPKGIAHALGLAEKFANGSKIAVMLGDNIFTDHEQIKKGFTEFAKSKGARLFLKKVSDPERFGVARMSGTKITSIIEKPKDPPSNLAVTGLYLYDPDVFEIIKTLKPSARGELEITDVNNHYVRSGIASYEIIEEEWLDAGTFNSITHASSLMLNRVIEREKRRGAGERTYRKLVAALFKTSAKLFQRSGAARLPPIRFVKKELLKYLKRYVPSFVVIDENVLFLDEQDRLELSTRGPFEPYENEVLKKLVQPGDNVLVIGAHIGYNALALARLVGDKGKVVAFEPDPINFALLEKNIEVNQYPNITPIKTGTLAIEDLIRDHLDGKVDIIKFDVDGRKRLAMQKIYSTLKKDSLILLMEYSPAEIRKLGYDPEQGFDLLRSNGFEIYCLDSQKNKMTRVPGAQQMMGKKLLCIKGEKGIQLNKIKSLSGI